MEDGNAWTTEKTSLVSSWKPTAMAIVEWQPPGRPQGCCSPSSLPLEPQELSLSSLVLFSSLLVSY